MRGAAPVGARSTPFVDIEVLTFLRIVGRVALRQFREGFAIHNAVHAVSRKSVATPAASTKISRSIGHCFFGIQLSPKPLHIRRISRHTVLPAGPVYSYIQCSNEARAFTHIRAERSRVSQM
jgi:hypothetical protein